MEIAVIVILSVFCALIVIALDTETPGSRESSQYGGFDTAYSEPMTADKNFDAANYVFIAADRLHEYGPYMSGEKVITEVRVGSASGKTIKAYIQGSEKQDYDFVFGFEEKVGGIMSGKRLVIAGIVQDDTKKNGLVSLAFCHILPDGAYTLQNEPDKQQELCDTLKQGVIDAETARLVEKKANYAAECETVVYNDVARNPDAYTGHKVQISGQVVQVSEDLLNLFNTNTVTLRIETSGGTWMVNYQRTEGESRILEGDHITCYGECKGVETYISVLGSTVTVPSMRLKYFDLNN